MVKKKGTERCLFLSYFLFQKKVGKENFTPKKKVILFFEVLGAEGEKKECYPFFDVFSTADTRLFRAEWRWKNPGVNAGQGRLFQKSPCIFFKRGSEITL